MIDFDEVAFEALFAEPVRNGIYKEKRFHGTGVPIFNMGELFASDRLRERPEKLVEVSSGELKRFSVRRGDLLFGRRSLVLEGSGKCSLVEEVGSDCVFESSLIRVRLDPDKADPDYYLAFFSSPEGRHRVLSIASQTAVSGIRSSDLASLSVPSPPLEVQRDIGTAMRSFDDLIETNRRRCAVLEQMARLIYREWFVDLRFPGHERYELSRSTIGPIPRGWELGTLGDIASEVRVSAKPSADTETLPYVPIDAIDSGRLTLLDWRPGSEARSSLRLFCRDDVLFGAMRAYFHKVCMAPFDGVTRSTCFVLRPDPARYMYAVMVLSDAATVEYAASHSSGSTIPYAKWSGVLERMPCRLPPAELCERLAETVSPLLTLAKVRAAQARSLSATRELLLPHLVTGESVPSRDAAA